MCGYCEKTKLPGLCPICSPKPMTWQEARASIPGKKLGAMAQRRAIAPQPSIPPAPPRPPPAPVPLPVPTPAPKPLPATAAPSRPAGGQYRAAPLSEKDLPSAAPVLTAPPSPRAESNPWGEDEKTDPGAPAFLADVCAAPHPTTASPCMSHPQHAFPHYDAEGNRWLHDGRILEGEALKTWNPDDSQPAPADAGALLAEILDSTPAPRDERTAVPATVPAPPPAAPVAPALVWDRVDSVSRARLLQELRQAFGRGGTMTGIVCVARLAREDRAEDRLLELYEIDARSARAKAISRADDERRWALLTEAISELGFDPRTQDGAPGQVPPTYVHRTATESPGGSLLQEMGLLSPEDARRAGLA